MQTLDFLKFRAEAPKHEQLRVFPHLTAEAAQPLLRRRAAKDVMCVPEPAGRFQRCCPYCNAPLFWKYIGRRKHGQVNLKNERPFCHRHGPMRFWRVIDWERKAIVSIAHFSETISPRWPKTPIPLSFARRAARRWKQSKKTRLAEAA